MAIEIYDDATECYGSGSSVSSARATYIDKSKTLIVAVLIAINALATVWMIAKWRDAERENRMLEYYVMELDGKLMAGGVIKPPESWSGRKEHMK